MSSQSLANAEFHPHIIDVFSYADAVISGEKPACIT
jgi:hypothetical protein